MGDYDIVFGGLESAARRDQILENGARAANHSVTYITHSDGDLVMSTPVTFDCTFSEPPIVTSGSVLLKAPDPARFSFPRCNVGVYRWVTQPSPAGLLYTGCYLYFTVDVLDHSGVITTVGNSPCIVEHHVRWDGIGLKTLPPEMFMPI